ncbi:hypothetical protein D0T51_01200 [Parabacteroides sp. 52]|uniref:hypothetical protein n=1 Tax=unclassified Parabacteroides TaxID=2649774 RepID=UPI0013D38210|nr:MULTISPECIES: hypothetical protein [unclassified Parabacteroides]MDH6533599.1 opacity protein-like surface antigen [Parabacteroides sp. PM5-20]NDV54351.1 hypothetical protein [Parabacteroides sp. 52]
MKRIFLLISLCLATAFASRGQELTLEYNLGYATFRMSNLKDVLSEVNPSLTHLKLTDNFPAHFTHQVKVGYSFNPTHQAGIALDLMNTVGNKGVADYSGSYHFTLRTKGVRLGSFYRISILPKENRFRPYMQLTAGVVFNNGKLSEELNLEGVLQQEDHLSMDGLNLFVEPAIGCQVRLWGNLAFNINAGYEIDITKKLTDKSNRFLRDIYPDWSGLRIQGGLFYILPL